MSNDTVIDLERLDLPESLAEVVDVIGLEQALRLVDAFGGVRVYVPERMTPEHILVRVIGHNSAWQLASHFGGEQLSVPRCVSGLRSVRNAQIRRERQAGASPAQLALRYGMTERQVYSILATSEPEQDPQQSLL